MTVKNRTRPLHLFTAMLIASAVQALNVEIMVTRQDVCNRGGRIEGFIGGGVGPFELVWSSGHVQVDYGVLLDGVLAGTYSVTVTDANNEQAVSGTVEILAMNEFPEFFAVAFPSCGQPMSMLGLGSQFQGYTVLQPLTFMEQDVEQLNLNDDPCTWGTTLLRYDAPPGTERLMPYVDWAGCPGVLRTYATAINDVPTLQVVDVQASCINIATGRCRVITTGEVGSGNLGNFTLRLYRENGEPVDNLCYTGTNGFISRTFEGLAAGTYFARLQGAPPFENTPLWGDLEPLGWGSDCQEEIQVIIPSNGQTCGRLQGRVYLDANSNCTRQINEIGVPGTVVEILPGPYYAVTTVDGTSDPRYALTLPVGNYTITEQNPSVTQTCGGTPIPFTVTASTATVDIPTVSAVPLDVQVRLSSGAARPGFELQYAIAQRNLTPTSSGNMVVTMQLDPGISYLSATPTPTSVNGSTLTWNQTALGGYQHRAITIRTQVPPNVDLLGSDLVSTASVTTVVTDGDLANNSVAHVVTVTGSYDPNDKLAVSSSGSTTNYDPAQDQWIDYTIRFQNTGTDTAFNVVITDTLPANLDPGSIQIGAASHGFTWTVEGQATLKFWLLNIQLPHTAINEPRSHGFVSFRIRPRLPLASGAQIINRANIYFDFNPPIITDPSVLTVPTPPVLVSPRLFLGGIYTAATPPMTDALRMLNKVPRVEPYTGLGYAHAGTGGGEMALPASLLLTGNNAIVDWVVVELRQAGGAGAVVASRAALLQRDGDVVGPNGTSPVAFYVANGTSYRIAVRHRNHLGVMTSTSRTLTTTTTVVDFTQAATTTYGTNARNSVGGTMVLWPGDANINGEVKYTGADNDRDVVLQAIGGIVPTNTVNNVYDRRDVNLDGTLKYTGANNDRDVILQTIGGTVPTAVRTQQLP